MNIGTAWKFSETSTSGIFLKQVKWDEGTAAAESTLENIFPAWESFRSSKHESSSTFLSLSKTRAEDYFLWGERSCRSREEKLSGKPCFDRKCCWLVWAHKIGGSEEPTVPRAPLLGRASKRKQNAGRPVRHEKVQWSLSRWISWNQAERGCFIRALCRGFASCWQTRNWGRVLGRGREPRPHISLLIKGYAVLFLSNASCPVY